MVEVGVGEPDPAQFARIDHRRQHRHELGAARNGAGVDEDGLATVQHERVDGERAEGGDVGGRCDHIDAGGGREAGGHDPASFWASVGADAPRCSASAAAFRRSRVVRMPLSSSLWRLVGTSRMRAHVGIHRTS